MIFCRFGFHRWRYIKGEFHQYFECARCCKRTVLRGIGGYQPIDGDWLGRRASTDSPPRRAVAITKPDDLRHSVLRTGLDTCYRGVPQSVAQGLEPKPDGSLTASRPVSIHGAAATRIIGV
jgi:hypothetical protein